LPAQAAPQSVISTAPRPVWSIHTPSGPGAAKTAGQVVATATAMGPAARLMTAFIKVSLAFGDEPRRRTRMGD
jgi:hypothetical protein